MVAQSRRNGPVIKQTVFPEERVSQDVFHRSRAMLATVAGIVIVLRRAAIRLRQVCSVLVSCAPTMNIVGRKR